MSGQYCQALSWNMTDEVSTSRQSATQARWPVVLRIKLTSSIYIRYRPASVSGDIWDEDETDFDDVDSRCFSY